MRKQVIPPYPTLDIQHLSTAIAYSSNDTPLNQSSLPDGTIALRTEDGRPWTAQNDQLTVSMLIDSDILNRLKYDLKRILPSGATAGMALIWHSKGSLQRGVSDIFELDISSQDQTAELKIQFKAADIRDTLSYQPIVFLKKAAARVKNDEKHKCNTSGAILGYPTDSWTIRADGRGSVFPLFPVKGDREGPLWSLNCMWYDCMTEKFDADTVRVNINTNHPDCPEEWKSETATDISPLTKSILRDAIGTLILSIKQESENWQIIIRTESLPKAEFEPGSVAHAAWHFYTNNSLNDESPASVMKTAGEIKI